MKALSAALKDLNSTSLILYRGMAVGSSEGLPALAWCSWQHIHGLKVEIFSKSAEHLDPAELCSLHFWESMIYRDNPQTFEAGLRKDNISSPCHQLHSSGAGAKLTKSPRVWQTPQHASLAASRAAPTSSTANSLQITGTDLGSRGAKVSKARGDLGRQWRALWNLLPAPPTLPRLSECSCLSFLIRGAMLGLGVLDMAVAVLLKTTANKLPNAIYPG